MKHEVPAPPEIGSLNGLSYALFLPDGQPDVGIVQLHGAGSAKESHYDFGRLARDSGQAVVCLDSRGHGRSEGALGPNAVDDVLSMCELMCEHAPKVAIRGSSMGGFMAIQAAARDPSLVAVAALCPATEQLLLRGLREDRFDFACDRKATEPWLESLDTYDAVGRLGPGTALLLLHARGDEQVPYTISEELHALAHEPKRLLIVPGGHHRSIQHDAELQAMTLRFIEKAAGAR